MRKIDLEICNGPCCEAWSSDRIALELREISDAFNICRVPCMNECGGGVSIRSVSKSRPVNVKNVDEALFVLDIKEKEAFFY
ncbi:MAG: hypothetical protein F3741_00225 [Nitrospinae bacterium]|nr:hypothetical protein [Nitrospinota bacterium]